MLKKICPGCGTLMDYGRTRCPKCAQRRSYTDPKILKFYRSKEWKMIRVYILQRDGYKCLCGAIAQDVDHIIPLDTPGGWTRRLDPDNCRALCVPCHNKKHGRFGGGVGQKSTKPGEATTQALCSVEKIPR